MGNFYLRVRNPKASFSELLKFPKALKDSIGRNNFIMIENYSQIEKLWPVHLLWEQLSPTGGGDFATRSASLILLFVPDLCPPCSLCGCDLRSGLR